MVFLHIIVNLNVCFKLTMIVIQDIHDAGDGVTK